MSTATSDRLLNVLQLFAGDRGEWTVEAAAAALELTTSTTYRYFRSLVSFGLLHSYNPGRYVLGPAIIQFDRQTRAHDPLLVAARPAMEQVAQAAGPGTLVLLVRLYGHRVMCVHQHSSAPVPFATSYERGRLMPIDRGAASKVVLANVAPRLLRIWSQTADESGEVMLRMTPELRSELRQIRNHGFATTVGELDEGLRGIAVPIFQPNRAVGGSLSIVVPAAQADVPKIVEQLIRGRKNVEADLAVLASRNLDLDIATKQAGFDA